jgi:hypothetical protein
MREELPAHESARLVPFVLGAAVTTLAILGLHWLQMQD